MLSQILTAVKYFLRCFSANECISLVKHVRVLKIMFYFTGVAIYTGMETKMALNYKSKSQKRSAVEK